MAILFYHGKGVFLIAGYNTASREEKETIDEKKLGKYTGILLFALAFCWLFVVASGIWNIPALLRIGLALFMAAFLAGAVYMNTGNRLEK